jgi:hypothetical protein
MGMLPDYGFQDVEKPVFGAVIRLMKVNTYR